jgi:hypothetical protein
VHDDGRIGVAAQGIEQRGMGLDLGQRSVAQLRIGPVDDRVLARVGGEP